MSVEGHKAADGEDMQAFMNALSPGYFETMKIPIARRARLQAQRPRARPTVAIVNRRFAEHFFPGRAPSASGSGRAAGRRRS